MKIRSGFVSNSSSASFMILWKVHSSESVSVEDAVGNILDFEELEVAERVIQHTKQLSPNVFQSTFHTIMMNCFGDLGKAAQMLLFALYLEQHHPQRGYKYSEIISTNLNSDH